MRVVYWGTYDTGKPRNRIMVRGLKENGVEVVECHAPVWEGIEDKSGISGWRRGLGLAWRWLSRYPGLVKRYLALPPHDLVMVGYLGILDLPVLWPLAKWRRVPIVWDAFMSVYNTIVQDRQLLSPANPLAWLLYLWEWLACRLASHLILDTRAHADYFVSTFGLNPRQVGSVPVGVETDFFQRRQSLPQKRNPKFTVLFYGQYIPLHGIESILQAASMSRGDQTLHWRLIGSGQEKERMEKLRRDLELENVEMIDWSPYEQLHEWIQRADCCLGIFGATTKAAMVVPNKIYQILAAGRPLITADTPAIRELLRQEDGVILVPAADPEALVRAVGEMRQREDLSTRSFHDHLDQVISPAGVGRSLTAILGQVLKNSSPGPAHANSH